MRGLCLLFLATNILGFSLSPGLVLKQLLGQLMAQFPRDPGNETACYSKFEEGYNTGFTGKVWDNMVLYSAKGVNELGDFTACRAANISRYVLLKLRLVQDLPSFLTFGFCVPAECHPEDFAFVKPYLFRLVEYIMNSLNMGTREIFQYSTSVVRFADAVADNEELASHDSATFFLTLLLVFLAIMSVVFSVLLARRKAQDQAPVPVPVPAQGQGTAPAEQSQLWAAIACWDIPQNFAELSETKNPIDPNLNILHGVRILCFLWVMLAHVHSYRFFAPVRNFQDMPDLLTKSVWFATIVFQAPYATDIFLCISAFMSVIKLAPIFAQPQKRTLKTLLMAYINRYIRVLPLYLFMLIAVSSAVPKLISDGPITSFNLEYLKACRSTWIYNLLHGTNFLPAAQMCVAWSWYLSLNMQLFLLAPILIWLYQVARKTVWPILGLLAAGSIVVQAYIIVDGNLSSCKSIKQEGNLFLDHEVKPYCRINTYIMGLILGWMYLSHKDPQFRCGCFDALSRALFERPLVRYSGYIFGAVISFYTLHLNYIINNNYEGMQAYHNVLYLSLSRPVLVLGFILLFYPAILGRAKPLSNLLSQRILITLSKIMYGAYMVHPAMIEVESTSSAHGLMLSLNRAVLNISHILIMSFVVSFFCTPLFETPFLKMQKLFLRRDEENKSALIDAK